MRTERRKTKSPSIVKAFIDYFIRRGKRILRLKNEDFHHISIDVHPDRKTIWVWFHSDEGGLVGRTTFYFDGRCFDKVDLRKGD